MTNSHFLLRLRFDQSPEAIFDAVNNVPGWWHARMEGAAAAEGDEFSVRFGDKHFSKHRVVELIPGRKVVWLTTEGDLSFVSKRNEWTGTRVIFRIEPAADGTVLEFEHDGLVPEIECFGPCAQGWTHYIEGSLKQLIETGKGKPAS